jgi:hypothetical protein
MTVAGALKLEALLSMYVAGCGDSEVECCTAASGCCDCACVRSRVADPDPESIGSVDPDPD